MPYDFARRPRRLRSSQAIRDLTSETSIHPSSLIQPLFVVDGKDKIESIIGMEGVFRYSIDKLLQKVASLKEKGIKSIMLFPKISSEVKDGEATEALRSNGLIPRCISEIKNAYPDIIVISDVALDPYTSHGHDGIVENDKIDNDKTIDILCKQALILANSGVDMVAPSDMMDGRVGAIRSVLDSNGKQETLILSYASKYSSNLYSPFRTAVGSEATLGKKDKKTYQMDFRNAKEAIVEAQLDFDEGADILMVKPATFYLDIIKSLSESFNMPVFAYQVSGEYVMIKNAAMQGLFDYNALMYENLIAIKRSGARSIVTYAAEDIIDSLKL